MLKRILVAADLSPGAQGAARLAAHLAKSQKGEVHACYVIDRAAIAVETGLPAIRDSLRLELEREGRRALGRVATACRKVGVAYSDTLTEGAVTEELVKVARSFRADVIAMGTEGRGRLETFLWGSRAQELISAAPCPVLIVQHGRARTLRTKRAAPARRPTPPRKG